MKTIKCDRCSNVIPYVPPYMNAVKNSIIPPTIIVTVWEPISQETREVDLCDDCQLAVYSYIFNYSKATGA